MSLPAKIEKHLGRKIDFNQEVVLEFDSDSNQYIKEWNVEESQPSTAVLDAIDVTAELALETVLIARRCEYPGWREQLGMLYHDMTSDKGDKTGEWYKAIAKVKTDNPK